MTDQEPLILVDLGSVFWTRWYAKKLDGGSGDAAETFHLTTDYLYNMARDHEIIVCIDSPKSLRRDEYPEYKANRAPRPEGSIDCLKDVQEHVRTYGVPVVGADGYEADDIIATLAGQANEIGRGVWINTKDKDLACLVNEMCWMFDTWREFITPKEVRKKWGVHPDQMVEYLALVGDVSDNVPGCPGIGAKKAADLIQHFGCIFQLEMSEDDELREFLGPKTLEKFRAWDPTLALGLIELRNAPVSLADIQREAYAAASLLKAGEPSAEEWDDGRVPFE